jgi:hypothetical protein
MVVHLICPGLLGPRGLDTRRLPPTPALDLLLSRARAERTAPRDPLATLGGTFGLVAPPVADLPSAPLCLLALGRPPEPGACWFHADPVHLRADRDRLLLFAGPSLGVRADEAESLTDSFNAHFAGDGLFLSAAEPSGWYLRVPRVPGLCTRPIHQVVGHPIDAHLPRGPDAKDWMRWQNEAQMLFFSHPVNEARERQGRPVISGVWTWGGGTLPELTQGPDLTVADHPLALGLAGASGGRSLGLDGWCPSQRLATESMLVFWDRLWWPTLEGDAPAWNEALAALEVLMGDLLQSLRSGSIRSLTMDDGEEWRFALSRGDLRRLWRRRGTLHDWISRRRSSPHPPD